jgi:hypothetical protein
MVRGRLSVHTPSSATPSAADAAAHRGAALRPRSLLTVGVILAIAYLLGHTIWTLDSAHRPAAALGSSDIC